MAIESPNFSAARSERSSSFSALSTSASKLIAMSPRQRSCWSARGAQRALQQLLCLVDVGFEIDRYVTEKAQGERQREVVVVRFRKADGAGQGLGRQAILAEPVARLT